jgi:hypothetical protein
VRRKNAPVSPLIHCPRARLMSIERSVSPRHPTVSQKCLPTEWEAARRQVQSVARDGGLGLASAHPSGTEIMARPILT